MPIAGPVAPRTSERTTLDPLPFDAVAFTGNGMLAAWQETNAQATLAHCVAQLEASGTLDNLRIAAGQKQGEFVGFQFADSDVFKVLEAIGWEAGRGDVDALTGFVDDTVALLQAAQEEDGYLDSHFQVARPGEKLTDLRWGHELYCLGHLLQAGVAWVRTTGRRDILEIGLRFATLVDERLGAGGTDAVDGHPEVETALVEVYRLTGEKRWLDLAQRMIDLRGNQLVGPDRFGYGYFQDHAPVREVDGATGHSVRQLYLAAGVADAYVENGDDALLEALERIWADIHSSKMYVTGGLGSRHRDEAFGDPFELPPDRAYAETCAAISSVMFNWRMLLITGEGRFADEMERALYNAVATSTTPDGCNFFYSNPLQVRTHRDGEHEQAPARRVPWYDCACCPPNLARLVASLHSYAATIRDGALQLHLYESGRITLPDATATITTDYPFDGAIRIDFDAPFAHEVALRVPAWASSFALTVDGTAADLPVTDGYLRVPGGSIRSIDLTLDMPAVVREPHPHIDAVRGCVVVTRGPIVYALEQPDLPDGVVIEDVRIDADAGVTVDGTGSGSPKLRVRLAQLEPVRAGLYPVRTGGATTLVDTMDVALVPYYRWGNRGPGGMRVWLPTT
ncbi:glycoside hydrolase family 127 protein [Mycetocola manganoxydans]|uniref:Glycoside hydrolase family 127 protein n=1 Tax=Mycetocola manganoxydans TaxID=699879 RepID=A0A3L6ZZU7_9MICO|nr:beta-L-arabinofuranosidase domain-containing protein [Mycetocola manganoxydans]RLP73479.1 glycoside hydrolase family 127 protein [Mycetocola manganoxydans]GHD41511.1 hypothetical protein GCM10008097_06300 [Mycetocola manganoxydans]